MMQLKKHLGIWGVCLLMLTLGSGGNSIIEEYLIQREPRNTEQKNIRAIVLHYAPELAQEKDPLKFVDLLRHTVHLHVPLGGTAPDYDPQNLDLSFYRSLTENGYGHLCQGIGFTYMQTLRAFGIPARYVGLISEVKDTKRPNTHASVEVYIDGRWTVADPTFDMTLLDASGKRIGWTEARALLKSGQKVVPDSGGFHVADDRKIENYQATLDQLTQYMIFSRGYTPNGWAPLHIIPESWDSVIRYSDGTQFDMRFSVSSPIYDAMTE